MNQLVAIIKNTCLQTMRQPIYGLIVLVTLAGLAMLPSLTGWSLDDDNKMLRDMGLSTLLMQGLFLAAFAAASVLDVEIEEKTVLTAAAKPVGRATFVVGKFLGVLAAIAAAHYLASIAFLMAMRHGVMQSAADTMDTVVLLMGPGLILLAAIAAIALNYLYDRRFLPTLVMLALPCMTLGGLVLLFVNKEWQFDGYVTKQNLDELPADVASGVDFKDLIDWWPMPGNAFIAGHHGHLVRSNWKGPLSDADQQYLLSLSESQNWKKQINFLVQECRKVQGPELAKAAVLILAALAVLASIAVAASTRLGMMATFVVCFLALGLGLTADQVIKPYAAEHPWARAVYPFIPNFQFFWMIDALTDERVIPIQFLASAVGYAAALSGAFVLLGTSLFETREVG
jgi:hypothetical protein